MDERVFTVELTQAELSTLKICLFNYYARGGLKRPVLYDRAKALFSKLRQINVSQ